MMPSRGMGAVMPSKMPTRAKTIHRKDDPQDVQMYAKGGNVWDTPNPAKKHKKFSPAKKAGRPYPNLIDNMRMAK